MTLAMILAAAPAVAQVQAHDQAYTAKILEFTTEPFFATPLVDHLPASETVPTPLDILGHIAGAADVLTYPADIYRYMRAVADASPRVEVFSIGETEEGREMIVAVVSSDENMARLAEYKSMMGRLADPRTLDEATAEGLFGTAKPFYYATGAMHSGETGSPEMLMEIVYRLAVEETPFIQKIRDNVFFMTTPVLEVDGRAKQVDLAMAPRLDPDGTYPSRPLWWGKYVAHDDNRDGIGLSLALTKNVHKTFHEFKPLVVHDLHESASHLYVSTGRGPYNAWFDPIVINEWNNISYQEVREMTAFGVPGVYTFDFYDGWGPNYMFTVANGHNAIGRFYETQGAGDGSTRVISTNVERQWHRPNTPLPQTVWSIRNNVNLQQSALLIALNYMAENKEDFLKNFYVKGQRSIAKATTEGPAAYVFPADDSRPALQARLLQLMQEHAVEVHRLTRDATVGDKPYGAGSYVIRMDQPYSRMGDMLLDTQYYNPADPSPYDDVGWTLGPLFNVTADRVEDLAILEARMEKLSGRVAAPGEVEGSRGAEAFIIDYTGEASLASFRYANPDLNVQAAEEAFEADSKSFRAGSFLIPTDGNPENLAEMLAAAASEFGFLAHGVDGMPDVAAHAVGAPRVAVMHTWSTTQQEGWLRVGLDEYKIPYDYISVHEARDNANLKARWDVIIMGPASADALSLVRGVQGDDPIPWKRTEVTPNLGAQNQTDDMRGGLELSGIVNLQNFVEAGGVFITLGNTSVLPIHFGMAEGLSIRTTQNLWAPGGVFRTIVTDKSSPLAYGYGDELGVYFNRAPVFATGGGGGGGRGGGGGGASPLQASDDGSTTARRTGRGDANSPDIVQGRPRNMGQAGVEAFREAERAARESEEGAGGRGAAGAAAPSARIVARFAAQPTDLLISGGLVAGAEMANAPAVVDAPRGEGHIIMFSFNPFWRGETLGSYAMVMNALLHHEHLGAGNR
ncbi:MAG: M14 family zinc carboxypeptidase [Gemmatimonadota bacterium]